MDEQQVDPQLRARVDTLEVVVREGFDRVSRTFDRIADQMEKSEHRDEERAQQIHERLDRIADQSEERYRDASDKATDRTFLKPGPLIGIVSVIWAVLLAVVGWGFLQQEKVAVAQAKSEFMNTTVGRVIAQMDLDNDRERTDAAKDATLLERVQTITTRIDGLGESAQMQADRDHARFTKLEDWQKFWYRNIPETLGAVNTLLADHQQEILHLHDITDASIVRASEDRTGMATIGAKVAAISTEQQNRREAILAAAETRGKLDQAMAHVQEDLTALRLRVQAARPDPFYGKQGDMLEKRIASMEEHVRAHTAAEAKE